MQLSSFQYNILYLYFLKTVWYFINYCQLLLQFSFPMVHILKDVNNILNLFSFQLSHSRVFISLMITVPIGNVICYTLMSELKRISY